jgi:uncharacterized membrane protein YdfJ with MMPL/SSD domain
MLPLGRMRGWNIGAGDLPTETESRRGHEALVKHFSPGWMGPLVLVVEAHGPLTLWSDSTYRALLPVLSELDADPRNGPMLGLPRLLSLVMLLPPEQRTLASVPTELRDPLTRVLSADGRVGLVAFIPPGAPEARATMAQLAGLRGRRWPEAERAGLRFRWGGSSAIMHDFDHEMFGSVPRVILAVVLSTFLLLVLMLRSLVIPL